MEAPPPTPSAALPARAGQPTATATPADDTSATVETSGRRAVDLNTGSLEELDSLEGGGKIGRTIIGNRPYASPDDLVRKRVLTRGDYDRIKDQVTVQ
jgi:DNA uptake protein ComE-like DNA-binding protein